MIKRSPFDLSYTQSKQKSREAEEIKIQKYCTNLMEKQSVPLWHFSVSKDFSTFCKDAFVTLSKRTKKKITATLFPHIFMFEKHKLKWQCKNTYGILNRFGRKWSKTKKIKKNFCQTTHFDTLLENSVRSACCCYYNHSYQIIIIVYKLA